MPPVPDGDDAPNVLWLCTDQHRYDFLGAPHDAVATPRIDGLAGRGARFEHAYCQSPVCTPSRASFLTGRYPRTTRCRQNGQNLPADEVPITRRLADAGYVCGLAGKHHVSRMDPRGPSTREYEPGRRAGDGYAVYHWAGTPGAGGHGEHLARHGIEQGGEAHPDSEHVRYGTPAEHHHATWTAERAVDFLATRDERPWCLSVNFFDPHQPFDPPREYLERQDPAAFAAPNYVDGELDEKPPFQRLQREGDTGYDATAMDDEEHRLVRAAYAAMVELVDDCVGRVLDALERTGERGNTLVVFHADHGELLGDHGIYRKGPQFYDPAVRVPLILAGPGVEPGVREGLVELVDLAPTVAEACGVDHEGTQGRSLWPALAGENRDWTGREDVYCEFYNAQVYDVDDPDEVLADPDAYKRGPGGPDSRTANATMVRTRGHKLVAYHGLGGPEDPRAGELYDLERDPAETTNRWADPDYRDVRARLLRRLADRMAATVDPLPERGGGW